MQDQRRMNAARYGAEADQPPQRLSIPIGVRPSAFGCTPVTTATEFSMPPQSFVDFVFP